MLISKSLKLSVSIAALSLATFTAPAYAQINEGFEEDVIVTTAQRRAESLQDVPVAVTVVDAAALETRNIEDTLDLQAVVPNLNIATNGGTANVARIFLRGIGEDESRGAVEPAVGTYIDGVYIGRLVGSLLDLVDLQQVEVLRGPQGTLYGRNSNGGAIKITSVKPQQDFAGSARVTYGNLNRFDGKAMLNVPIGETTAARISGLYKTRDGYVDANLNGDLVGNSREDIGAMDTIAIRGQLSQDIGNWNILLSADYTEDDSDPVPGTIDPSIDADGDIFTLEPAPGMTCSSFVPAPFLSVGCFSAYSNETKSQGVSATITGDFAGHNASSITAFRRLDDDLSTQIGLPFVQQTDQEQFSQEITLASDKEGPFNYVVGGFYFKEDLNLDSVFAFPFRVASDVESFAVFGQAEYEISDRATLTGGLRYTTEDREFEGINFAFENGSGIFTRFEDQSNDQVSYTVKGDYDVTEDLLVYASYATGFKGSGFSPDCFSPAACFLPVDQEEVDTIEFGFRSEIWDKRLRLNGTYFYNQYDNLQIGATVPGLGFTRFNVDETEIQGIEMELQFRPSDRFELTANLGLLDGEYKSLTESQAGGLTNDSAGCPGTTMLSGQALIDCALDLELKNGPDYKANIAAVYTHPFANGGELDIGGDISFEDDSFALVANTPFNALSDIPTLINARIAYRPADSFWDVSLWARNLTDETYHRAGTATANAVFPSEPATYGVTLGLNFD